MEATAARLHYRHLRRPDGRPRCRQPGRTRQRDHRTSPPARHGSDRDRSRRRRNTVTVDNTTVVTFAKPSGTGTVTGTGTATASSGVATKTVTGALVGSVTHGGDRHGLTGTLGAFTVIEAPAAEIALTGSARTSPPARHGSSPRRSRTPPGTPSPATTPPSSPSPSRAAPAPSPAQATTAAASAEDRHRRARRLVVMEAMATGLTQARSAPHGRPRRRRRHRPHRLDRQPRLRRHPRPDRHAEGRRGQHRHVRQLDRGHVRSSLGHGDVTGTGAETASAASPRRPSPAARRLGGDGGHGHRAHHRHARLVHGRRRRRDEGRADGGHVRS